MTKENKVELIKIIIVYAITIALMLALSFVSAVANLDMPTILRSTIIYICIFIPVIVYSVKKGEFTTAAFGFKRIKISTIFLTILLAIVCSPMYMFANVLSQLVVPNVLVQNLDNIIGNNAGASFIAVALMAPICEEIICRGFFHNRLSKVLPFGVAAVVSGIMFGLLHLNLNQFCYALVLGVVFAYVNRASGSIFTSMIIHMAINGSNMLLLIVANMAAKSIDMDIAEVAESQRNNPSMMLPIAVVYGVLAVISFFLTRLVINKIAKNEGTMEII